MGSQLSGKPHLSKGRKNEKTNLWPPTTGVHIHTSTHTTHTHRKKQQLQLVICWNLLHLSSSLHRSLWGQHSTTQVRTLERWVTRSCQYLASPAKDPDPTWLPCPYCEQLLSGNQVLPFCWRGGFSSHGKSTIHKAGTFTSWKWTMSVPGWKFIFRVPYLLMLWWTFSLGFIPEGPLPIWGTLICPLRNVC